MNRIKTLIHAIICVIALVSCSDDTADRLQLEFKGYDPQYITVEFTPAFYIQGIITANAHYAGELTLTCTNYPEIYLSNASYDPESTPEAAGFTVTKTSDNQLTINFRAIETPDAGATIEIMGKNKDKTNFCIITINRCN